MCSQYSFRDNASNAQLNGDPREFRSQAGWGYRDIYVGTVQGKEIWDVEQSEGVQGLAGCYIKYEVYKNN